MPRREHPLLQYADKFIEFIDITEKSKRSYESILNLYIGYLEDKHIRHATRKNIIQYRDSMFDKGLSASTVRKTISILKGFYKYLSYNQMRFNLPELYVSDLTYGIKSPVISKKIKKLPLTKKQAVLLLDTLRSNCNSIIGYRDYAIFYLMITTGLRGVEVIRAKKGHLAKLNNHSILYVHGKGRQDADEFVKIPKGVTTAINNYLNKRSDNSRFIFVTHGETSSSQQLSTHSLSARFKKAMSEIGLDDPRLSLHSLRHTAATLNILRGGSIESTQALLRHAHIETTKIYLHQIERVLDESEFEIEQYLLNETKVEYDI